MSIAKSVSEVLVPIHREGYRFIAIFAAVTLVLFWLAASGVAHGCDLYLRRPRAP